MVLKTAILTLAVILAASQLGIDTTIITIAVSSVFFSVGLGAALMVGLGGRGVAAARALRYVLISGDVVQVDDVAEGVVVTVHSTSTEFETPNGNRLLVPNGKLLEASMSIQRADRPAD